MCTKQLAAALVLKCSCLDGFGFVPEEGQEALAECLREVARDDDHAREIMGEILRTRTAMPKPVHLAAIARKTTLEDLNPVHCRECWDSGVCVEWDEARPGYCKPGCPTHYCECVEGRARKLRDAEQGILSVAGDRRS